MCDRRAVNLHKRYIHQGCWLFQQLFLSAFGASRDLVVPVFTLTGKYANGEAGERVRMKKLKGYKRIRLVPDAIREINQHIEGIFEASKSKNTYHNFTIAVGDEQWSYDNFDEFIAEYPNATTAHYNRWDSHVDIQVTLYKTSTDVAVRAEAREAIQKVFNIVEQYRDSSALPVESETEPSPPAIFIGHGRNQQWRDLKDHLHEKHGFEVQAYEIGARAGHTIRDILGEMLENSSFAILVLTGEDETADHRMLARQNVVHEAGLFQGHLGFARAIILLEEGTEEFSNIAGVQQVRYSQGNIKETFGEILAVLRREFGN